MLATMPVAQLAKAHGEGQLEEKITHNNRPKLLIVDELGYPRLSAKPLRDNAIMLPEEARSRSG